MEETLVRRSTRGTVGQVELVSLARTGDRDAFDALMAGRVESTFRTALAILGHEADARDATQETFVRAWRELGSLREVDRFDAWFGRILVNTCRTALRSRYRSRAREIPAAAIEAIDERERTPRSGGFEDQAADLEVLERAFERLAIDERVLLVLHHLDRHPVAAMARMLGIPEGTAKSRLYTARRTFERAIEVEQR